MKYRLGTRKSQLAQTQSRLVQTWLAARGVESELVFIESQADVDRKTPLYEMEAGGGGLFTKELERALLDNRIDLAVHSLKDLPTLQPPELKVSSIPKRESANDCFFVRADSSLSWPPPAGTKVGTSSLRREALVLHAAPGAEIFPLRGNVPTRLEAVRSGKLDAVILAAAGINRLQLDLKDLRRIDLNEKTFVPAPGQGALGIETRADVPADLFAALQSFHDVSVATETRVERKILRELEGGCTLPLGVRCVFDGKILKVQSFLGLLPDPKTSPHRWTGFHYFDISLPDEAAVIDETVRHFRGFIRGRN